MGNDGFASRTRTASSGARLAALTFVALLAGAVLYGGGVMGPAPSPSPSATVPTSPMPLPSATVPASPSSGQGWEWAILHDRSGLAAIGAPTGIAVGDQGIVATGAAGVAWSADGTSWTPVAHGPAGLPVVATPGGYFALGGGVAWSSADGRAWTTVDAVQALGFDIKALVAAGTTLIAVGSLRDDCPEGCMDWGAAWQSTDGWTWRRDPGVLPPFDRLAASGGVVVAAGRRPDETRRFSVLLDDGTWSEPAAFGAGVDVAAIAARPGGGFVAVGTRETGSGRAPVVLSSADGSDWRELVTTGIDPGSVPDAIFATDAGLVMSSADGPGLWWSADATAWTRAADVPSFELGPVSLVAAAGDRLIALGGQRSADDPTVAWTSPPIVPEPHVARTWTAAGLLPAPTDGDRLVALADGSLLLLGGTQTAGGYAPEPPADLWRRDGSGAWTNLGPMPFTRASIASALAADGRVWIVGGYDPDGPYQPVQGVDVYDPATGRWSTGPALPTEMTVREAIGLGDGTMLAITDGLTVWRSRPGDGDWQAVTTIPWAAAMFAAAPLPDGSILLLGSRGLGGPTPECPDCMIERYVVEAVALDPTTGAVEPRTAPVTDGSVGTLVRLADGRLALVCQVRYLPATGSGQVLRRVDVYDPGRDAWSHLTDLTVARWNAGVAVDAAGRVWVAGGEREVGDMAPALPTDTLFVWTPPSGRTSGR